MLKTSLDTVAKLYVQRNASARMVFIFRNTMSMWREYLYFRGYRIKHVNLKLCSSKVSNALGGVAPLLNCFSTL